MPIQNMERLLAHSRNERRANDHRSGSNEHVSITSTTLISRYIDTDYKPYAFSFSSDTIYP